VKIIIDDEEPATARGETPKTNAEMIRTCSRDRPSVDAKNPIGLPMVVFAAFRLLASSDHGQPYIKIKGRGRIIPVGDVCPVVPRELLWRIAIDGMLKLPNRLRCGHHAGTAFAF
jgi:hypothetical protein